jgi:hypothetical protein
MTVGQTHPHAPANAWFTGAFGVWIFSLVCVIILPLFPLYVEAVKAGWSVKPENVLLTAAVLSADT